jgi:hypothetical protein
MFVVTSVDDDRAGTRAIRRALVIFGGGEFLFAILLDRADFDFGLGEQAQD